MVYKYIITLSIVILIFNLDKGIAQADSNELKSIVYFLSDDDKAGRENGSEQSYIVSNWIRSYYLANGLEPFDGSYFKYYNIEREDSCVQERNVIGLLRSTDQNDQQYIIVSAHFDHLGLIGGTADSIFNGANDNATGTSALLYLIKELKRIESRPYNIVFAAFSGEEEGLLGSSHFADNLPMETDMVQLNINLEMLGRTNGGKTNSFFITGSDYTNLKDIIREFNQNESWSLDTLDSHNLLFLRSDNYSFVKTTQNDSKSIPAHTFGIDTPDTLYYHTPGDEAQLIDFENLWSFSKYMGRLIDHIGKNKINIIWIREIQYEFELESDGMKFNINLRK